MGGEKIASFIHTLGPPARGPVECILEGEDLLDVLYSQHCKICCMVSSTLRPMLSMPLVRCPSHGEGRRVTTSNRNCR